MCFLLVDKILELVPGRYCRGLKTITADDTFLQKNAHGSFFPPSLIGETLGQLAAWNVMSANDFTHRPVAGIVGKAQMFQPAYVGQTIELESFIDDLDDSRVQYHSLAKIDNSAIFSVEDALGPLLPMEQFIHRDAVKQQFEHIMSNNAALSLASTKNLKTVSFGYDRLINIVPNTSVTAELFVDPSAPYFPDHFPLFPVLPMTVLLECKLNLAQQFLHQSSWDKQYKIKEMRKIKMKEFVQPGEHLLTFGDVKTCTAEELIISFRSEMQGKRVCVVDLVFEKV